MACSIEFYHYWPSEAENTHPINWCSDDFPFLAEGMFRFQQCSVCDTYNWPARMQKTSHKKDIKAT